MQMWDAEAQGEVLFLLQEKQNGAEMNIFF